MGHFDDMLWWDILMAGNCWKFVNNMSRLIIQLLNCTSGISNLTQMVRHWLPWPYFSLIWPCWPTVGGGGLENVISFFYWTIFMWYVTCEMWHVTRHLHAQGYFMCIHIGKPRAYMWVTHVHACEYLIRIHMSNPCAHILKDNAQPGNIDIAKIDKKPHRHLGTNVIKIPFHWIGPMGQISL